MSPGREGQNGPRMGWSWGIGHYGRFLKHFKLRRNQEPPKWETHPLELFQSRKKSATQIATDASFIISRDWKQPNTQQ